MLIVCLEDQEYFTASELDPVTADDESTAEEEISSSNNGTQSLLVSFILKLNIPRMSSQQQHKLELL